MNLLDIHAPYTRIFSFLYELIIAPAVARCNPVVRDTLDLPLDAKILDVGCGAGHLAVDLLAWAPTARITGIDLSPDQIRRARRHTDARLEFEVGSVSELPFADASFDAVVSVTSLKHWHDRAAGLAECIRVCRPGGQLVIMELDRGARFDDAWVFTEDMRFVPPGARVPLFLVVRALGAGASLDLDDARALGRDSGLVDIVVERVPGKPLWILSGRRQV